MALASVKNQGAKLNHRKVFDADHVKETMGLASEKFAQYKEVAEFLASKKFSSKQSLSITMKSFLELTKVRKRSRLKHTKTCLQMDKMRMQSWRLPGAELGAKNTWWDALNSVTYLTDHKLGRESDSRMGLHGLVETKLERLKRRTCGRVRRVLSL